MGGQTLTRSQTLLVPISLHLTPPSWPDLRSPADHIISQQLGQHFFILFFAGWFFGSRCELNA